MAWAEQWSIKVDGNELNSLPDGGPYATYCPEVGWIPDVDVVLVPRDNDYPVAVAMQPTSGIYTFLIQMTACDWATYDTRLTQLKTWLAPGAHTFTFQIRGMPTAKSVQGISRGMQDVPKERRVVSTAVIPAPVLI